VFIYAENVIAIYMAADNNMVTAYCNNLEQIVNASDSTENTSIHIFADTPAESYRFLIHDSIIDTVKISSNVNSGDYEVVADFYSEVFSKHPDAVKIAVMWDHGNGWYNFKQGKSILFDNNPNDFISVTDGEMKKLFEKVKRTTDGNIDILVFDACQMQTLEVAYELSGTVDYIVASEDLVPYLGLPYEKVVKAIDAENSIETICKSICDIYFANYDSLNEDVSMSIVCPRLIKDDIELLSFNKRDSFSDIDSVDVSVQMDKSVIYNKTYNDKFKGIKIFFPYYFAIMKELYTDYVNLNLDKEFNIIKSEFDWYGIPDTFNPLPVTSCSIRSIGNENYRIDFNRSYDFSQILKYDVYHTSYYTMSHESFDTLPNYVSGDLSLSSYFPFSKPYSIFAKSMILSIDLQSKINVIKFSYKGAFSENPLVIKNNGNVIYSNNRYSPVWETVCILAENGNFALEFNPLSSSGSDYMYFDDFTLYEIDILNKAVLYDTTGVLHKVFSGDNIIFIKSLDKFMNESEIGGIFSLSVCDSVKVIVYPNPARDIINIASEYEGEYQFNLYTVSGGLVDSYTGIKGDDVIKIDIRGKNLIQGMYFYSLKIGSKSFNGKLTVVK